MPVDTTIQYNGYNSFKLLENEVISCSVFGVEGMAFITTSFQSYCPSAIATGVRMYVRFFDASNAIISTSNHSFALTASAWVKQAQTLSVPATAIKAQIFFTNPVATAWYMAQPKCEEGEVASSFTINLSAQLTHIAPDGIYTGFLSTNQIIVSGTDTLDTALTSIINGQITLVSNYNTLAPKVTRITADGIYTGSIVASQITAGEISVDRLAAGSISGVKLADGTIADIKIASGVNASKLTFGTLNGSIVNVTNLNAGNIVAGTLSADRLAAGSITADKIVTTNLSAERIYFPQSPNDRIEIIADGSYTSNVSLIKNISGADHVFMRFRGNLTAGYIESDSSYIGAIKGNMAWSITDGSAYIGSNNHRVGADNYGPYYIKSGVKTYF